MSIVTVTTEQVRELIQQLAAMTSAASITPEIVANIFENMRQLNDQERAKVIATAEAYIAEIENTGISAEKVLLEEGTGINADNAQDAFKALGEVSATCVDNSEFIEIKLDAEGKILYGVKKDGTFVFGVCPQQIIGLLENKVDKVDGKQLSTNDYTTPEKNKLSNLPSLAEINEAIGSKVDKVEGKSLINAEYAECQQTVNDTNYIEIKVDRESKILEAITADGNKFFGGNINVNKSVISKQVKAEKVNIDGTLCYMIDCPEYLKVLTDSQGKIIYAIKKDGSFYIPAGIDGINEKFQAFINDFISPLNARVTALEDEVGAKKNTLMLNLTNDEDSYILSSFNLTNNIKQTLWFNNTWANRTFNFRNTYLVNKVSGVETLVKGSSDDIAPVNFGNGGYIGGNHGLPGLKTLTVSGHDKTFADIGSIWSNGTRSFTLVKVETNKLSFVGQNLLEYPKFSFSSIAATGTLTHVSGATHTGDVVYTAKVDEQWWPFYKEIPQRKIYLDNVLVSESGSYNFNVMKVSEDYDILNPASVVSKVQDGVGTFTANPTPQDFANTADTLLHISNVYTFNSADECLVATSLCLYQEANFAYFGFTQCATFSGNNQKLYIPKAKSLNNGVDAVDFRTIANWQSGAQINSLDWEEGAIPPDRILGFDDNIGLQIGYVYDYGVGGNNRASALASNIAIQFGSAGKLYPYGWGNPDNNTMPPYSNKSAVCFRKYIDRAKIGTGGIISKFVCEYNSHCYIYADFNAEGDYYIDIPAKYQGGEIETLEKRDNVTLLTDNASDKIMLHVESDSVMYGYFVGKI